MVQDKQKSNTTENTNFPAQYVRFVWGMQIPVCYY